MGVRCSLARARRPHDRIAEGQFYHLRGFVLQPLARDTPVIGLRTQLWVCAAASRARGAPVIGLRRGSFSISVGLCCSLPRTRHSRDRIADAAMGLRGSLPHARHCRDRIAEGQF